MTRSSQTPFTSSTICLTDAPAGGAFNKLRHDLERGRERDRGEHGQMHGQIHRQKRWWWWCGLAWGMELGTWKQTGRDWRVKACQKYKLKLDMLAETASFSLHRPLVDTQVWESLISHGCHAGQVQCCFHADIKRGICVIHVHTLRLRTQLV